MEKRKEIRKVDEQQEARAGLVLEEPTARAELAEKIKTQIEHMERIWLPKLNQVSKRSLAKLLKNGNEAVQSIPTVTLDQTN